jgi:DNA-binding CsgD family transcriptional regulator
MLRAALADRSPESGALSAASSTTPQRCAVVVMDTRGRIRLATSDARRLMQSYFKDCGPESGRLPLPLQKLTRHYAGPGRTAHRQIITAPGGKRFTIAAVVAQNLIVLVFEKAPDVCPPLYQLTSRQSEILALATEGKQNKEISKILSISPRTVQHHLERVYQKLGVENRTAAARMFLTAQAGKLGGLNGLGHLTHRQRIGF